MNTFRVNFALLTLALAFHALGSTAQAQNLAQQIDAIFQPYASHDAPGMTVIALRNGRVIFEGAYGVADLKTNAPITLKTDFRLASLTKEFTAMAIMLLAHDGKLRYDDPITRFFPEFPVYGKQITVRHLLNHTSGLLDYEDIYDAETKGMLADKVPQIHDDEILRMMEKQSTTKFQPGTRWEYSNTGYALLAMIIQRVSGKTYPEFLHDRVFQPLKMTSSVAYVKDKNAVPNRAFGYRRSTDGKNWDFSDQSPTSAVLGDGGIYTNVGDMAKWDAALRNHALVSAAEMQAAITPVPFEAKGSHNEPAQYGFGWFVNPYKGHTRMWHYGETCGFLTSIQRLTDDHITVIVLANRIDIDPGAMALKTVDLMLAQTK
jgi:CubicO group peptidase (beta-lactamase class C family)